MSAASLLLYRRRRIANAVAISMASAAAIIGLLALGWILWTLLAKGYAHFNLALFTQDQPPPMDVAIRDSLDDFVARRTREIEGGKP